MKHKLRSQARVRPTILRSGFFDLLAGLAVAAGTSMATTPTYQVVPILPPAGWTFAEGVSLNDLGQVTGFASNGAGGSQAFIGSAAGSVIIPLPPGWRYASGNGINNAGQVAGYGTNATLTQQAFVGTTAGSTAIPLLPGWTNGFGYGINSLGQVAGWGNNPVGFAQAFIGTPAGSAAIPVPTGWMDAAAYSINNSGQVAGYVTSSGPPFNYQVFIGTLAGSVAIPLLRGWTSAMTAQTQSINNLGQVTGTGLNGAGIFQAFIGTAAGSMAIPLLAYGSGPIGLPVESVGGINDLGQVVGIAGLGGYVEAWIWDTVNGTRALNTLVPAGWSILTPNAINNRGQILADAYNSATGYSGTVVLTPLNPPSATPVPPSALLVLAGLASVAFYQLRRARRSL